MHGCLEDGCCGMQLGYICCAASDSRQTVKMIAVVYSGTSEERTLWERHFCPLFGGCPLLGGCLIFALYPPPLE